MRIGAHETHPAADAFPLMRPEALKLLVDDIRANGLRRPIVLHEGRIVDGRNRYLACIEAKVEPTFTEYAGDAASILRFVASENQARRHQTADSLALSARRMATLARVRREQAKRQAKLPGVPEISEADADRLLSLGAPEMVAAVDSGDLPLGIAVKALDLSRTEQRELAKAAQEPEVEPVRAKRETAVQHRTVALALEPADVHAMRAGMHVLERSVHGEVRALAALLRRIAPTVQR